MKKKLADYFKRFSRLTPKQIERLACLLKITELLMLFSGMAAASVFIQDYGQFAQKYENIFYFHWLIFWSGMALTIFFTFLMEIFYEPDDKGDDDGSDGGYNPFDDPPPDPGSGKNILNEANWIIEKRFRKTLIPYV